MDVVPLPAFRDNYIWCIIDESNHSVYCIDPGDGNPVLQFVQQQGLQLQAILLTHHHQDHIGGVPKLLNAFPEIKIYGPKDPRIPYLTHALTPECNLSLGPLHFLILDTPGHTATHLSYYEARQGWLFCGDTLFSAGCGRVFDGTLEALYESLQKLKALPNETQVFCAHEYTRQNLAFAAMIEPHHDAIQAYAIQLAKNKKPCSLPSSIGIEKEINPFFRTEQEEVKHYVISKGDPSPDSLTVFKQLRQDKDRWPST